ncbi:translation initiation factor IF-2 N-terminal domain-containing protein [Tsukamurella pseudospumae]|uniref:Ribonuclease E n=1 Tax=Tsukamurella pseudospumae TaxID=239498 RepID=A0A138AK79_9ACTN|nr:translation initiation factor IF-2 N-terminal domain-containing protein [Tsukamurella pseudospumae]KXP10789.1 ribonuclease E [Tsukamurella pseudospumae]
MADNTSPEEQNNEAREEFPQKLRVHALARLLGLTSKEVLAHLGDLGFVARSAHSSIDRSAAERVRDRIAELAGGAPEVADQQVAAEPATAAPAEPVEETPSLFSEAAVIEPIAEVAPSTIDTTVPLFLQPEQVEPAPRKARAPKKKDVVEDAPEPEAPAVDAPATEQDTEPVAEAAAEPAESASSSDDSADDEGAGNRRRRRGRRGRGRGRGENADEQDGQDQAEQTDGAPAQDASTDEQQPEADGAAAAEEKTDEASSDGAEGDDVEDVTDGGSRRRRRRRRRRTGAGEDGAEAASSDDPPNTVVHEREPRESRQRARRDEVRGISGSTRLEAKRQRRRDGRDTVRRRPPILTESEFLARREAVDRVMVVRERTGVGPSQGQDGHTVPHPADYTQVAVLEDGVLVEHFVTSSSSASMVGNIYLGRVQNVLPSMEAAFVDIGRGRNGVLYAGEVNWDAAGLDGNARKIEQALKPGDQVLVQVSKDPVGHKGARLTTQISLAGRFLVYVPGGGSAGISRKLPDTERKRLKEILKEIVPADAGVIIRTASEGVSAEELAGDVARLQAQWAEIEAASSQKGVKALYEEPDLLVKVVRDLFNEDFSKLVIEGRKAWDTTSKYVGDVAPDLLPRVEKFEKAHADAPDVFATFRIDEQLAKAMDRKVWLPSGGTLVIDRTEAMTVVDVNTGKFTGAGGNLEETVTRNNLEAAEEIVRQMRLRDIGGMIVVDFIDMVLESNRDLVLRRLTEALGRDRTRHQVSEVTSLGLVQMTRKRIGTGLVEAFSTPCQACAGRGIIVHDAPVESAGGGEEAGRSGERSEGTGRKKRKRSKSDGAVQAPEAQPAPAKEPVAHKGEHPMFRAMAAHHDEDGNEVAAPVTEAAAEAPEVFDVAPEAPAAEPEQAPAAQAAPAAAPPEAAPVAEQTPAEQAPSAPRRRRVARKAPTTTSASAQTIVVDIAIPVPDAPTAPAGDAAGASVAEPARKRARRRAAARPAGPAAGGVEGDGADKADQPV